jgi:hypothetical protein
MPDALAELIYEKVLEATDDLPDDLTDGAEAAAAAIRAMYVLTPRSVEGHKVPNVLCGCGYPTPDYRCPTYRALAAR